MASEYRAPTPWSRRKATRRDEPTVGPASRLPRAGPPSVRGPMALAPWESDATQDPAVPARRREGSTFYVSPETKNVQPGSWPQRTFEVGGPNHARDHYGKVRQR